MGRKCHVVLPKGKIAEFCKRHYISKLSLFGSCLHGDFRPDSALDHLVKFEMEYIPGLITLLGREIELSEIIGRKYEQGIFCYETHPYITSF